MRAVLIVLALGTVGCAYHAPDGPTPLPTPTPSTDAAAIRLTASSRGDQGLDVLATVLTTDGHFVPHVAVTFSASTGTLTVPTAMTDDAGAARTVLTNAGNATVTATAANLSSTVSVLGGIVTPAPTPGPAPPPPPAPPTITPSATLNVPTTASVGVPVTIGVSSQATGVTWLWTFGDGGTAQTAAFTTTHTYASAGVYSATVSANGVTPGRATITVSDAPPPPAPLPGGLQVTFGCTAGTAGGTTACNLAATYNNAPVQSTSITQVDWDWGDGQSQIVNGPPAAVGTHVFTSPGTYIIVPRVTATTVDGSKQVLAAGQSVTIK